MSSWRHALAGLGLVFALGLTGCGFTPLYSASGFAHELADIRVSTGPERVDFKLQEALLDGMGARHAAGNLTLTAVPTITSMPLGAGADAIARRYSINVSADWSLHRDGEIEPVMTGTARSEASYDVPSGVYGSLTAELDAEDRAINMVANRIIVQVARAVRDAEAW